MSRDEVYLKHILDAITKIERYVSVGREEFMESSHWQDAVVRQLEIIGEAAKRVSENTRNLHDEVPWRRVCGLRDVLIHDYMGVDLGAVWQITQIDIPVLRMHVEAIANQL